MSCREGHNSVMTSLVWFLTRDQDTKRADESLVKQAFHDLKRAYGQTAEACAPPTPQEVEQFLLACQSAVRHDPRIKDRLRPQWLAKIDAALADTRSGTCPDTATFRAWQHLEEEVRRRKESAAAEQIERMAAAATPGDAPTLQAWSELVDSIRRAGWADFAEGVDRAATAAYATFAQAEAVARRAGTSAYAAALAHARRCREEALDRLRQVGPGPVGEEARRAAQEPNRRFAELLACHPDLGAVRAGLAHCNQGPEAWAALRDCPVATRAEQWTALEFMATSNDTYLASRGMLDADGPARRRRARAEYRRQAQQTSG